MLKHSVLPAKTRAARVRIYQSMVAKYPGSPREALWQSAPAQIHFAKTLAADVAQHKRRSAGAKKGWAKRKGAVAAVHIGRGGKPSTILVRG